MLLLPFFLIKKGIRPALYIKHQPTYIPTQPQHNTPTPTRTQGKIHRCQRATPTTHRTTRSRLQNDSKQHYGAAGALPGEDTAKGEVDSRRNRKLQDGAIRKYTTPKCHHHPIQRSRFSSGEDEGEGATTTETSGRRRRPQAPPSSVWPKPDRVFTPASILCLRPGCGQVHRPRLHTAHAAMATSRPHLSRGLSPQASQLPPLGPPPKETRCPIGPS